MNALYLFYTEVEQRTIGDCDESDRRNRIEGRSLQIETGSGTPASIGTQKRTGFRPTARTKAHMRLR